MADFLLNPDDLIAAIMASHSRSGMIAAAESSLWCNLPFELTARVYARLGVTYHDFAEMPAVYVPVTDAIKANLAARGIYGSEPSSHGAGPEQALRNTYYLQIVNNSVFIKYQSILGSWRIGVLSPEQMAAFEDHLTLIISTLPRRVPATQL